MSFYEQRHDILLLFSLVSCGSKACLHPYLEAAPTGVYAFWRYAKYIEGVVSVLPSNDRTIKLAKLIRELRGPE